MVAILFTVVALSVFGDHFQETDRFPIPKEAQISGEGGWTDWSYCSVNPDGDQAALINPGSKEVLTVSFSTKLAAVAAENYQPSHQQFFSSSDEMEAFDLEGWIETMASNGRKRDQVNLPLAVDYTSNGELLISDMGSRRILQFGRDRAFMHSFILTGQVAAPNEIKLHPDGAYVAAGLNLDSTSAINAGDFCTVFSPTGEVIRSFAYSPQIALDRNLWVGVSAVMDIDDDGKIYVSFSVEGDIYIFDIMGRLLKRFNYRPEWFVEPPVLDKPVFKLEREPAGFWKSWTRIIKILCAGKGIVVLVAETNGLVPGIETPFIVDILSTDGHVLASGIASDYWPVGRSKDNHVYWLSYSGNHVIESLVK